MVVLVHEFGHFLAARKSGVKVHEFSIVGLALFLILTVVVTYGDIAKFIA